MCELLTTTISPGDATNPSIILVAIIESKTNVRNQPISTVQSFLSFYDPGSINQNQNLQYYENEAVSFENYLLNSGNVVLDYENKASEFQNEEYDYSLFIENNGRTDYEVYSILFKRKG